MTIRDEKISFFSFDDDDSRNLNDSSNDEYSEP